MASHAVEMALVAQVLLDRELAVDARVLEDDPELAPDVVRLRADVEAADARRAAGRRRIVARMRKSVLPPPFGPSSAKSSPSRTSNDTPASASRSP
jgi:hypothetical protein